MRACVIIPTFNERDNIKKLLEILLLEFERIEDFDMEVLVVDDNSPDGTGGIVKDFTRRRREIHLIQGERRGLGAAYVRGFRWALERGYDVLLEMDADFSHDPKIIPKLLEEIKKGHDFVIGSRYINGGVVVDWGFRRIAMSRVGNLLAQAALGMQVRDCTSGFRAIRADTLRRIDLNKLGAGGYAFQVELLFRAYKNGARIVEIPIVFPGRKFGKSKLGIGEIPKFLLTIIALGLRDSTFLKFALVGLSGVLVNMFFLWFLTEKLGLHYLLSSPAAVELAVFNNFLWNHLWTFKNRENSSHFALKFLKFNSASIGALVINFTVLFLLTELLGVYYLLSNLVGIASAASWNYIVNSNWTWRQES